MAITKKLDTADALEVSLNNGDLKALNTIKNKWGFKDKESAIRFALAVLLTAESGTLYVVSQDGSRRAIQPIEDLLEDKDQDKDKNQDQGQKGMMDG